MIRYLGKRYNSLMMCMGFDRPFTCTEACIHPNTAKGLANNGFLKVDRVGTRHVPYLYSVPDRIRSYYGDQL